MNITNVSERSIPVEPNIIAELDSVGASTSNALPREVARDRRERRAIAEAAAAQAGRLDGTTGKVLKLAHQRKLGTVAMLLWRWLLDERGPEARPRPIVLKAFLPVLARDYRERALRDLRRKVPSEASMYKAAKRALEQLRVAGAVRTNAYKVTNPKWERNGKRPEYVTTLLVTTFGEVTVKRRRVRVMGKLVRNRRPEVIIRAPDGVIAWCETTPGHGGDRSKRGEQVVPLLPQTCEVGASGSHTCGASCPPSDSLSSLSYVSLSSLRSERDRRCAADAFPVEQRESTKATTPSIATVPPRASAAPIRNQAPGGARPVRPAPVDPLTAAVRDLPAGATAAMVRAAIGAALSRTMPGFLDPVGAFVAMQRARARRGQHVHPAFTALEAAERSTTGTEAPPG